MRKILFALLAVVLAVPVVAQEDINVEEVTDSVYPAMFFPPDYDVIGKVITDKNSGFYYPDLLCRFAAADTTMTIEELHCLYYGSVLQKSYDPYSHLNNIEKARDILEKGELTKKDLKKAMKLLDKAAAISPADLMVYLYRHYARVKYYGERSTEAFGDVFRYTALLETILSSGSGTDFDGALHVAMVNDAYQVMNYFGLEAHMQSLQFSGDRSFDVYTLQDNDYGVEELYFDITPCFSWLTKSLSFDDVNESLTLKVGTKATVALEKRRGGKYGMRVVAKDTVAAVATLSDAKSLVAGPVGNDTVVMCLVNAMMSSEPVTLLVLKSGNKDFMYYDTEIRYEGRDFEPTSNVGIPSGAEIVEMWKGPVEMLRLKNLRRKK